MKRVSFVVVSVILAVNASAQEQRCKRSFSRLSLYTYIHALYYDCSIQGYSVVIYNNNKYTIIKLQWGKNIYICYNKKYLHEFIYSHKNSFNLRRVWKKVRGDFPFKT